MHSELGLPKTLSANSRIGRDRPQITQKREVNVVGVRSDFDGALKEMRGH